MQSIFVVRLLIVVSIIGAAALIWAGLDTLFFAPIAATQARIAALDAEISDLGVREARATAQLPALPVARSTRASAALVSTAASASASSEAFQETIRNVIASVHGSSISSQASVQNLAGGGAKVSVLVRARFDEMALLGFTRAIESNTPPMIFESFEIHPVQNGQRASSLEFTGVLTGFHADAR